MKGSKEFKDFSPEALVAVDNQLEAALAESVLTMEGNCKILTPVDTGRLRASISSRSFLLTGDKKGEAVCGTNVEYAQHVEYGTKYQPAQPYMRPGAEMSKYDIEAVFVKRLGSVKIKTDNLKS